VLSQSSEDFDNSDDIYEAIGEILHEISSNKTENEIRNLCDKFHAILKPENDKINQKNRRILDAPMMLGQMAANVDADIENMKSIWVQQKKDALVS
jgi:ATP-binding cassette, subfamily F, member 3